MNDQLQLFDLNQVTITAKVEPTGRLGSAKGPQADIKTGAFVQGRYFPLLAQEGLHS